MQVNVTKATLGNAAVYQSTSEQVLKQAPVYERYCSYYKKTYSLKKFDVEADLDLLHDWMNREAVAKIWKMDFSKDKLREEFQKIQKEQKHKSLYIGMVDGEPMSYWEGYWVKDDLVGKYVDCDTYDQGLHFLFSSYDWKRDYWPMIQSFVDFLFQSDVRTKMVIGEPDESNRMLLKYCHKMGFEFNGKIELPHKTASFITGKRNSFYRACKEYFQAPSILKKI